VESRYNTCINPKFISFNKVEMKKIFSIIAVVFLCKVSNAQMIKTFDCITVQEDSSSIMGYRKIEVWISFWMSVSCWKVIMGCWGTYFANKFYASSFIRSAMASASWNFCFTYFNKQINYEKVTLFDIVTFTIS
jgi:hypothetical protein